MDSLRSMDCIVRCVVCLKDSLSDLRRQLQLAEEQLKHSSMMKVHICFLVHRIAVLLLMLLELNIYFFHNIEPNS